MAEVTVSEFLISDEQKKQMEANFASIDFGAGVDDLRNDCKDGVYKRNFGSVPVKGNVNLVLIDMKDFATYSPMFPSEEKSEASTLSIKTIYQNCVLFFLDLATFKITSMLLKTYGRNEFGRAIQTLQELSKSNKDLNFYNVVWNCGFREKTNKEKRGGKVPTFRFGKVAGSYTSELINEDGNFKPIEVQVLPESVMKAISDWKKAHDYLIIDRAVFLEYARINHQNDFKSISELLKTAPDIAHKNSTIAALKFYGRTVPNITQKSIFDFSEIEASATNQLQSGK